MGAFRTYVRVSRRRAEPMAFAFGSALNVEQVRGRGSLSSRTLLPLQRAGGGSWYKLGLVHARRRGKL